MATPPRLRGIPLNTASTTDYRSFAPVYDPAAIRFARKVNFAIGAGIGIGLAILLFLFFSSPAIRATETSPDTLVRVIFGFVLPILFVMVGLLTIVLLTPRIGFDLPGAYRATADALREWLGSTAGDFPAPKEKLTDELKESFATPVDSVRFILDADSESYLHRAAQGIARLSPEAFELLSKDEQTSILELDSTGRYQLTVQGFDSSS